MVRFAIITNLWAPANNLAGQYGFRNNIAGKSVLSLCGRVVWKDPREKKKELNAYQKLTSVKEDLDHQVDRMNHSLDGSLFLSHPVISQWTHEQSGHGNGDRDYTCARLDESAQCHLPTAKIHRLGTHGEKSNVCF